MKNCINKITHIQNITVHDGFRWKIKSFVKYCDKLIINGNLSPNNLT